MELEEDDVLNASRVNSDCRSKHQRITIVTPIWLIASSICKSSGTVSGLGVFGYPDGYLKHAGYQLRRGNLRTALVLRALRFAP